MTQGEAGAVHAGLPLRLDRLPRARGGPPSASTSWAAVMIGGGLRQLVIGGRDERRSLEDIAEPLPAERV